MKKIHIFGLMTLAAAALVSCEAEKDPVLITPSSFDLETPAYANQVITLADEESLELECVAPAYNLAVVPNYQVEVSLSNNFGAGRADVPSVVMLNPSTQTATSIELSAKQLNKAILDMRGITEEADYTDEGTRAVYMRVISSIGVAAATQVVSNVVTLSQVQDYYPAAEITFLWTPGDANGWTHGKALKLASTDGKEYTGFVYLKGGFKFTDTDGWSGTNYGDAGEGKLSTDGGAGNINTPDTGEGLYYATVNIAKLSYKLQYIESVNIPGGFNDWNPGTAMSTTDYTQYTYTNAGLGGNEFKFAFNGSWSMNLGGAVDNLQFDGGNLMAPAGATKVTLDFTTYPYSATFE